MPQMNPDPMRVAGLRHGVLWTMIVSLVLGGLLGTWLVLIESRPADSWRLIAALFGLSIHCAAGLLLMGRGEPRRFSSGVLAGLLVCLVNGAVLIGSLLLLNGRYSLEALAQTFLLIGAWICLIAPLRLLREGRSRLVGFVTLMLLGAGVLLSLLMIWAIPPLSGTMYERVASAVNVLAIGSAFVAAAEAIQPKAALQWLRVTAQGIVIFTSGWVAFGIVASLFEDNTVAVRVAFVGAMLSACSLGTFAAASALLGLRPSAEPSGAGLLVALICPCCQKELKLAGGKSRCESCDSEFELRVRLARCASCGYDLSNLRGSRCPECGAPAVS